MSDILKEVQDFLEDMHIVDAYETVRRSQELHEKVQAARASGATVPMTRIAESKIRQLGGDVCGVLVRKDGKLAAVDEHGRVQWLQGGQGAEPVAEVWPSHHFVRQNHVNWLVDVDDLPNDAPLYLSPQPVQQGSVSGGDGWIKCSERLPTEKDRYVWLYFKDHGVSEDLWQWDDDIGVHGETHWRPTGLKRPQPPKEGEGDE